MEFQGDLAQIYAGCPVKIASCNVAITQPKVMDICAIGEDHFLLGVQTFTRANILAEPIKEGNSQLAMFDDFQILMIILEEDVQTKVVVQDFLKLVFPNYTVKFEPGSLGFYQKIDDKDKMVGRLDPSSFEEFQRILKILFLPKGAETEQYDYNPANEAAAKIAEKLKRGNQIRQQMQMDKQKENNNSLFANYISVLSVGLGLSAQQLLQYTPFQLYDAFTRYTEKMAYDLYQKIATTPLMDVSKMKEPDNWMDGLY